MAIVLTLLAAVLVVLTLASTQSGIISIRRSIDIQAPPQRVFALIEDFHHWKDWAPQDRMDPSMQRSFGGAAKGLGAFSEWTAKGQAGCGRMEIVECEEPSRLLVQVDFAKPFKLCNRNEFTLETVENVPEIGTEHPPESATAETTRLSWAMQGPRPFPVRVMSVFINLERRMGHHFESGLQALKDLAERRNPGTP
jgi:uncharacterized protein YndB with AHSA1/START domain